jgi:hypothetical protein
MKTQIAILVLLGAFSMRAAASSEKFDQFSRKCGLSPESKSRIFAAADGEHWKGYTSLEKIPEANIDWSEGAFVLRSGEAAATEIDGVSQDFSDSSLYCFDAHGKLTRIEREFRTAWGWGYSEMESFKNGAVSFHQDHYFDTKTDATIPRPAGYDNVHDAMKLKMYKSVKELPFFKLMRNIKN